MKRGTGRNRVRLTVRYRVVKRDITAEVLSRIKLPEGAIQSTVNNCKSTRVGHNLTLGTRINRDRPRISKRSFIRTDNHMIRTRTARRAAINTRYLNRIRQIFVKWRKITCKGLIKLININRLLRQ